MATVKTTKQIKSSDWGKIKNNPLNYYYKIGFYDEKINQFIEVARYRNSYTSNGSNYGLLQIWSITFDYCAFSRQGSNNVCGGYDKPYANLEAIVKQLKHDGIDEGGLLYPNYCSVDSGIKELTEWLQKIYAEKLFIVRC